MVDTTKETKETKEIEGAEGVEGAELDKEPEMNEMENMTDIDVMGIDPVFEEEQAHLLETYTKLESMSAELSSKIARIEQRAASDKYDLSDEITLNATSFDEALETYAAFAAVNRVIDEHNIAIGNAASKLADVRILLDQPYFAKIVIRRAGQDSREIYIGTVGITDKDYKHLVVDWRSPVAEVYYNQANGPTTYVANGRTIAVDLELRRQFDIQQSRLNAYFDTTLAIEDPLLWEALSTEHSSSMKAITTTIQREQNTVIRHEDTPALLVSGVAGSGKTSVLLQRIAYLFYQHRDDLHPDQVFLLTPNPVFRRYIANVLPDLGESNPISMTWREWATSLLPRGMGMGKADISLEKLDRIEEGVSAVETTHKDYREIIADGIKFITANQIDGIMAKYRRIPMGPRRITLVREELLKRFDQRIARMAASDEAADEVESLSIDEQIRLFHETIAPQTEEEVRKLALVMLNERYAFVREAIERNDWLRIDRIGMRLLGSTGISPLEWLFTNICLTGLSAPDIRYVMIDEIQDYTPAQLVCLARYFRRANFMMLGDENQALGEKATSFTSIEEVFMHERGCADRLDLMISYRSTPQITGIFAKLATDEQAMQIESVHPDGEEPIIRECASKDEYVSELRKALELSASDDGCGDDRPSGLSAVILDQASRFVDIKEIAANAGIEIQLVDDAEALPESGLFAISLELAKGLEFDRVIIPDASEEVYPESDASRRRLYTAISRATKRLTILSEGAMSPLLR